MNKKGLIFIILIIAIVALTTFVIKKNNVSIIQGEVDTKTVDLSSKITGRVKKIHIKKGDMVKAGQLLITLDTPDISAKAEQATATLSLAGAQQEAVNNGARSEQVSAALSTLQQAQAGQELARKTYARMKKLNSEGVIPTQKLDEASAQYKSASRAVDTAKANYHMYATGSRYEDKLAAGANVRKAQGAVSEVNSYLTENKIKSPMSGQITEISVEEGELVGAGYPIVTVVSTDDNWVVFNLREDYLQKIRIGTEFDVKIPAIRKAPITVKVNYISAMGNFATWRATRIRGDFDMKTFEVRAVPVEKIDGLRAGMTVVVDWNKVK